MSQPRIFVLREAAHMAAVVAFLARWWRHYANEGRFLQVTVQLVKDKRSLEQNRRYWKAVITPIAAQAWADGRQYDKGCWHEFFKREFIGVLDLPMGGVVAMSTTDLSVEEFSDYMAQVEAYAATELNVVFHDSM